MIILKDTSKNIIELENGKYGRIKMIKFQSILNLKMSLTIDEILTEIEYLWDLEFENFDEKYSSIRKKRMKEIKESKRIERKINDINSFVESKLNKKIGINYEEYDEESVLKKCLSIEGDYGDIVFIFSKNKFSGFTYFDSVRSVHDCIPYAMGEKEKTIVNEILPILKEYYEIKNNKCK